MGYRFNPSQDNQALIGQWKADVHRHQVQLANIREEAGANVDALSSRIGLLQAHVMRLDALGRKLVHMASIDTTEFDFDSSPPLGGPETDDNKVFELYELSQAIAKLGLQLSDPLAVVGQAAASLTIYWPFALTALIPVLLTLFAFGIVGALMIYVVPDMVGVLETTGQELPLSTRFLIAASEIARDFW